MSIFNSLGSNYSWKFTLKSLYAGSEKGSANELTKVLGEHFGGQAYLTYKGREALQLALLRSGIAKGNSVGINGFTCYVVFRAVELAGYKPVFIDIAEGQINFSLKELKQVHANTKDLKAIIIQNTLGYPADMSTLQVYCDQHKIMIIEDLAHSLGAVYNNGKEAGTVGDFTMLSFSQDKPLDVVAGGAVVDKTKAKDNKTTKFEKVSWWQRELNRDYPFWTGLIRSTYSFGLGHVIHFILKKVHFLATPMGDAGRGIHNMSSTTARLILLRWSNRDQEAQHRKDVARIYIDKLPKSAQLSTKNLGQPYYLRFPLWVDKPASLIGYLKKSHIYVGDTWYDAPIGPKRYLSMTNYQSGQCPRAEELAKHIINLPTHINVSDKQAEFIASKVGEWLKSQ